MTTCACTIQPCDCDPNTTVTSADISLLAEYVTTIGEVVESPELTTKTPGGREIDTLTGSLTKLGYQAPEDYAGAISFATTDNTKTIDRDGIIYAPYPSALPFVTSGTWDGAGEDAEKFYPVQSVMLYDGTVVISKATVADMSADAGLQIGNVVRTEGYLASGDFGGAAYKIVAAGTGTPDGGRFIDLAASLLQAQSIPDSDSVNVAQFGAVGNGTVDDSAAIQAAVDAVSNLGGGELEFPLTGGGIYKCNFILRPGVSLKGVSRDISLIPNNNSPVITFQTDADVARVSIRELTIDGTANQGTFIAQDGIRIAPDVGVLHTSITIEDCLIKNCGAAAIVAYGQDPALSEQISLLRVNRCTIQDCNGSGIYIEGSVAVSGVNACDILDNGDGTDTTPNVILTPRPATSAIPQNINFIANRLETESYVSSGVCFGIFGALDVTLQDNSFGEFHTAVKIDQGPNGVVNMLNNRFQRSVGDIDALVEVVEVNGFNYNANNVNAATTGPIGLLFPESSADAKRIDIGATNSFGGLTQASERLPRTLILPADTSISLPQTNGPVPLSLSADGAASVNTLNDFNGGIEQFVHGDTVNLTISNVARTITLAHGTGNMLLAGGVNFALDTLGANITLSWYRELQQWVEVSRAAVP